MGAAPETPSMSAYTQQDLNDAYTSLLSDLNQAYWAASDMDTKDRLYGYVEVVTNMIVQLNAGDLATRDAAYTSLIEKVAAVNTQLKSLQQQINSLISRINTTSIIVSDIAKVLTVASQLMPT